MTVGTWTLLATTLVLYLAPTGQLTLSDGDHTLRTGHWSAPEIWYDHESVVGGVLTATWDAYVGPVVVGERPVVLESWTWEPLHGGCVRLDRLVWCRE